MRHIKKALSLAVASGMALSVALTGCGSSDTAKETAAPAASSTAAASTSTAPKDKVTLNWFLIGNKQEIDTDKVCEKANEYLKDKLNATVKLTTFAYGDDYETKMQPKVASGEPFDICFTSNWALNYRVNAALGAFYPLNSYLEKYPKVKEIIGADFLSGSAINGKNFALPTNKEKAHNWGFLLKQDLVDKYKVDTKNIKKMEDLEAVFAQIKAGEPGVTPLLAVNMDSPYHLLDWDNISDDDIPGALYNDNRDSKIINQFTAPESVAMYKKMREYYTKGFIHADAATQANFDSEMRSGKYFASVMSMKPGKAEEMTGSTGIKWAQVDITKAVMTNRETTGAMLAIGAASKNPERAYQFLEMLYTDKFIKNLFDVGIEGEHYVKVSDNVIKFAPKTENGAKSNYNPGNGWKYGNQFVDYLFDNEDPQKWQKFESYNKNSLPLNSLGFAFNGEKVSAQAAACKNVVQAYYKQLFTGSVDPDIVVPKMDKELKSAGVEKLIAEMQSQYDAWRAKNGKK